MNTFKTGLRMSLLIFSFLFCLQQTKAQLKLGQNPTKINKAALLELASTNQGLRLTRVDTAAVNDIISNLSVEEQKATNGLIVFQKKDSSIYFRSGGYWRKLSVANPVGYWSLEGNAHTDPTKNFLGTTDKQSLIFKVHNTPVAKFDDTQHSIAFGEGADASKLNGVAIGVLAKLTQNQGIAIGESSESDYQSVAIGLGAKTYTKNDGNLGQAISIGNSTSATSSYAIAIGNGAKAKAKKAMALGKEAKASGQNSTAIGVGAIANKDNTIILGSGEKVGINTSNPNYQFDVNGTGHFSDALSLEKELIVSNGSGVNGQVLVSQGNNVAPKWEELSGGGGEGGWNLNGNSISNGDFLGTTSYNSLVFKVNKAEVGYLGTPGDGDKIIFGRNSTAGYQGLVLGSNSSASGNNAMALGNNATAGSQSSIAIGDGASTTGNSSIAIGNASTNGQFAIAIGGEADATQGNIAIGRGASANVWQAMALGKNAKASGQNSTAIGVGAVANKDNTIILGSGEKVGINTSTPNYQLDVTGDINASGEVKANGVTLTSDVRYKKDLERFSDVLSKLEDLHGYTYYFRTQEFKSKNFSSQKQIGMIAQEVEKVFPELVSTDRKGYKSLNYAQFTAVLLEAVKAQQKEIKTNKKQQETQQDTIDLLKTQLQQLREQTQNLQTAVNHLKENNPTNP